jgi:superfamily I DNA/RNA helicase
MLGDRIASDIAVGRAPHEIAVLCRTNALVSEVRTFLRGRDIPVADYITDKKPKDWRLLQLLIAQIAAPTNWAVARMIVRAQYKLNGGGPDEAGLDKIRKTPGLTPADWFSLPTFEIVRSLNASFSRYGIKAASHELLNDRIRLYEPETVTELAACLRESPEAKAVHGVNVMTCHGSKGEEWNSVYVPGLDTFKLSGEETEAERRLFFVAATRAKVSLVVSYAARRNIVLGPGMVIAETSTGNELFQAFAKFEEIHA